MSETEAVIEYLRFERDAPGAIWAGVANVYVLAFASAPYGEPEDELRGIEQWDRTMLAASGGRLTIATREGQVLGFAISERLDRNAPWQRMLQGARVPGAGEADLPATDTVIIQELAVDDAYRGRGIAKTLATLLLEDRREEHAVLSVYGRAVPVRAMYQRWGFAEVATAPAEESDDTLHLMHQSLPWKG